VPRPSTFPEADLAAGGDLAAQLRARRGAGESFETIARWLLTSHAFTVSAETVRRWCADLDAEPKATTA